MKVACVCKSVTSGRDMDWRAILKPILPVRATLQHLPTLAEEGCVAGSLPVDFSPHHHDFKSDFSALPQSDKDRLPFAVP